jgi:Uncharacterized protein conserved in bacteria (DUF2325)
MEAKLPGLGMPMKRRAGETPLKPFLHVQTGLLDPVEAPEPRRRRIWEISNHFHCSIVGTCLTTSELRQLLVKMKLSGVEKETDHELHGRAVLLAGQRELASKLLQKTLDRRHRSAIERFSKARSAEDLRSLWDEAVHRADIPGGYWAVLTHPQATEDLVRHVFGEVHMLSHLVGAANRADIRRLRELERENAALQEKVARQQRQLQDAVVSREAIIANLKDALSKALVHRHQDGPEPVEEGERDTTARLVSDLRQRLEAEMRRHERTDRRLQNILAGRDGERRQRQALQQKALELTGEIESAELALARLLPASEKLDATPGDLAGLTLLYVGGRLHQVARLRALAEQCSATLLHHDGGIDDRSGLLEAQVARADRTLFPVDCVSHNAVAVVKRVARSAGKPFMALRSSSLTSFTAALRSIAVEGLQTEASDTLQDRQRTKIDAATFRQYRSSHGMP